MRTGYSLLKYDGPSKYKYVSRFLLHDGCVWRGAIYGNGKNFDSEREAAIYVDKRLLENGKSPVNILKPKKINPKMKRDEINR